MKGDSRREKEKRKKEEERRIKETIGDNKKKGAKKMQFSNRNASSYQAVTTLHRIAL